MTCIDLSCVLLCVIRHAARASRAIVPYTLNPCYFRPAHISRYAGMAPIVKSGNSWKNLLLLNSGNERLLDEEDIDFASDVYALAQITTDELLNSWKVFTALKDESYQGRRLENAAWRLQAMQKLGRPASSEATSKITGGRCGLKDMSEPAHAQQDTPATSETASEPEPEEGKELHPILDDSWAAKHLLGVCLKNKLSNETVREILQVRVAVTFGACMCVCVRVCADVCFHHINSNIIEPS